MTNAAILSEIVKAPWVDWKTDQTCVCFVNTVCLLSNIWNWKSTNEMYHVSAL